MSLRAIYYDTETTGIKADRDRVIEIAAFDPVTGRTFEKMINPGCPIPAEATAIHHITNEMVQDCPSFGEIAAEFIEFCEGDVVLVAHNNDGFDIHFLRNEFSKAGMSFPPIWKFMDSLKWARRYRPDLPRHTLQFLRETYGYPSNNAHRALDDVIVLHQVFTSMIDDIAIDKVYALLNVQKEIQHMPFGKHQGKPFKLIPKDYVVWLATSGTFDKPENQQLRECFIKAGHAL
jgi:DNA polymerase-3 subunit epsilon